MQSRKIMACMQWCVKLNPRLNYYYYIDFVIKGYFVDKDVWENYIEVGELCCNVVVTYSATAIL